MDPRENEAKKYSRGSTVVCVCFLVAPEHLSSIIGCLKHQTQLLLLLFDFGF